MKKKLFLLSVSSFLFSFLFSCDSYYDSESIIDKIPERKSHRLTAEQAKQNALDFVKKYSKNTRATDLPINVLEVKAIGQKCNDTRSVPDSINLDSLFYVVNFDNNKGFVIAASDDREIPVFAYIEEGNYNDCLENNGYDSFMNSLIEAEIDTRKNQDNIVDKPIIPVNNDASSQDEDVFEIMYPLLNTKWNQTFYNMYCPGEYTGCVPTAISQICSFLKYPTNITWSNNNIEYQCGINWDEINKECSLNNGNPQSSVLREQISCLMRFWGFVFDAEYTANGTSVDSDNAISKMNDLGFNVSDLMDYDAVNVMNELRKGDRILYMRGNARYYHVGFVFRKYVDGHGWVVDGYIRRVEDGVKSLYVHCNWGWGGSRNGYFLSSVLNAEAGALFDDEGTPITRSTDFKYRLKTSTICR